LRPSSWRCACPDSAAAQPVTFREAGVDLRAHPRPRRELDRVQHRGPDASLPDRLQAKARLAAVADTVRKWPTPLSLWQRTDGSGPRSMPSRSPWSGCRGQPCSPRECPASSPRQSWFWDKRFTSGCAAGGHEAPVTGPGRHRIDRTGAHRGTRVDRRAAQRVRSFRNILLSSIPVKTGMASGHRDGVRMVPGGLR